MGDERAKAAERAVLTEVLQRGWLPPAQVQELLQSAEGQVLERLAALLPPETLTRLRALYERSLSPSPLGDPNQAPPPPARGTTNRYDTVLPLPQTQPTQTQPTQPQPAAPVGEATLEFSQVLQPAPAPPPSNPTAPPQGFGLTPSPATAPAGFGLSPSPATSPGSFGSTPGPATAPAGFGLTPGPGSPSHEQRTLAAATPGVAANLADQSFLRVPLAQRFPGERYQTEQELAPGVERALDRWLERTVVRYRHQGSERVSPSFLRTARALAALDHPAIPRVHDLSEAPAAFTLDLLEGAPLPRALREGSDPGLPYLLRLFLQVSAALVHAHARGVIHGELDAEAVWLGDHGQVWVVRWARARANEHAPRPLEQALAYGPLPKAEQARRHPPEREREGPSVAGDVWGLGQVLQRLVLGQGAASLPAKAAGVPPELLAILRQATARDPGRRYRDVASLAEDVRAFLDGRAVSARSETLLQTLGRISRNNRAAATVVLAFALLVVGVSLFATAQAIQRGLAAQEASRAAAVRAREASEDEAQAKARQTSAESLVALVLDANASWERVEAARRASWSGDTAGADRAYTEGEAQLRQLGQRVSAFKREGQREEGALAEAVVANVAARLREERGDWRLRWRRPPDPAGAAEDFLRLGQLEPESAFPWQQRYVALRRTGSGGPELLSPQEKRTLRSLAKRGGPSGEVALSLLELNELPGLEQREFERLKALYERTREFVRQHHHLPLVHEPPAKAAYRLSLLVQARGQGPTEEAKGWVRSEEEMLSWLLAADPANAEAAARWAAGWSLAYGLHSPWRRATALQVRLLERAAETYGQPEPLLQLVEDLHLHGRVEASWPFVEKLEPPAAGPLRARMLLARARARMRRGLDPGFDPETLELPEGLEAGHYGQRHLLRVLVALRAGKLEPAFAALREFGRVPVGKRMGFSTATSRRDFVTQLLDPTLPDWIVVELLHRYLPPGNALADHLRQRPRLFAMPLMRQLFAVRAFRKAQLGKDPGPTMDFFLPPGSPGHELIREGSFAHSLLLVTYARWGLKKGRDTTRPLLWAWASLNLSESTGFFASELQRLLAAHLRRRGLNDAAEGFAKLDALATVQVRPAWSPEWLYRPDQLRSK